MVYTHRSLSFTWKTGAFAAHGYVYSGLNPQGPQLQLDLSRQQEPLLLMDMSTVVYTHRPSAAAGLV